MQKKITANARRQVALRCAVCFFSVALFHPSGSFCEQEPDTAVGLTPLYADIDGSHWEECLRMDPIFCPTVLKAAIEQLKEEGRAVPAELQALSIRYAPDDVSNACSSFGNVVRVTIPDCNLFTSGWQTVDYWIGDEDCNGRCGAGCPDDNLLLFDCWDANGYYRYTADCIVHDACVDNCLGGNANLDCLAIAPIAEDDCDATDIDCCDAYSTRVGAALWDEGPAISDTPVDNFCNGASRCAPCSTGEGECTSDSQCYGDRLCETGSPFNTCSPPAVLTVLNNGPYWIQHDVNDRYVDAYETDLDDFGVVTRTWQDNQTQTWILTWVESDPATGLPVYTMQHMPNDRFIDAHTQAANDYRMVTREAQGDDSQKWVVRVIGSDAATGSPVCTIQQKETSRFADAYLTNIDGHDYHLVTRTVQGDGSQRWVLRFLGGELSFTAAEYRVGEAEGVATIAVQRTPGSEGEATVLCVTADGTATAPADYTATTQTLEWADGETGVKNCLVTVIDDWKEENDETVFLSLTDAMGAPLDPPSTATLTIEDNYGGPGALSFTAAEYSVREHVGTALVAVQRTCGADGLVSAQCVTADGTATAPADYTATAQTLEWADGETGVKNCLVVVHDDAEDEDAETVDLALTNVVGATSIPPSVATLTIGDNENDYTIGEPIQVTNSSTQRFGLPSVDIDSQGRFVVAFNVDRNGFNTDVHARSYDSTGLPLEGEFQVSDPNYGYDGMYGTAVSTGGQGDYLVVWDGYYYGVLARAFNGPGDPDPEGQFQVSDGFGQGSPDIARLAADALVVSWPGYFSILEGPHWWPAGPPVQTPGFSPWRVASSQTGGFWAVGSCAQALCVQRYDALGNEIDGLVNLGVDGNYSDIALLTDGKAVVCWDSSGDIFCRLLDSAGALLGETFPVNTFVAGNQTWPHLAADMSGNFIVVWSDDLQDGGQKAMFAQVFDEAGYPAEFEEFQVTSPGTFDWASNTPAGHHPVAMNEDGDGVFVWATSGPPYAVYAQLFNVPSRIIFADGFESGDATGWSAAVGEP